MKKKNIIDDLSCEMLGLTMFADESEADIIKKIQTISDINMRGRDGRTLINHAAIYGLIDVFNYLLGQGADITIPDDMGYTPLHSAVKCRNIEIAKILLEHGASVSAVNKFMNIPLLEASHLHLDIIKLLLEYGSDCHRTNIAGISAYKMFEAYPEIIKLMDSYQETHDQS